ncbi:MAG: hypothetical protein ACRD6X_10530 [Pyrinomonadaceae bacterium]
MRAPDKAKLRLLTNIKIEVIPLMTNTNINKKTELELFLQAEGVADVLLVKASRSQSLVDWLRGLEMIPADVRDSKKAAITREDDGDGLATDRTFESLGIKDRDRLHINRCRKIAVTVNFNGRSIEETFPPSTTVGKVKKWADAKFEIDKLDAPKHALQICGTARRPDEDVHIGTLTASPDCRVCFDLVPKERVEGAA